MGQYTYEINDGKIKGKFNIYQSKNGHIYIAMGNGYTKLSINQINDLNIILFELKDFNSRQFEKAYELKYLIFK